MKLAKIFTVSEVAKLAGWSRKRMLRHLLRLNAQTGGAVLRDIGTPKRPTYTVTLEALQATAPQWFRDDDTLEARVEHVEGMTDRLLRLVGVHTQQIATLQRNG